MDGGDSRNGAATVDSIVRGSDGERCVKETAGSSTPTPTATAKASGIGDDNNAYSTAAAGPQRQKHRQTARPVRKEQEVRE